MEYIVIYLPTSAIGATEYLNELSKEGWRVICNISNNGVILGREIK